MKQNSTRQGQTRVLLSLLAITWLAACSGSDQSNPPSTPTRPHANINVPSQVGQWSGPYNWPIVAVHVALLPSGKVLVHDALELGREAKIWDPSTNVFSTVPAIDNIFCSGGAPL